MSADKQYLDLVQQILNTHTQKMDRTGTGTIGVFGTHMEFNLLDSRLPLLTTKKVNYKAIFHELLWMLSGDTNVRYLIENGVNIWNSWVVKGTQEYRRYTVQERVDMLKRRNVELYTTTLTLVESENKGRWTHKRLNNLPIKLPVKKLIAGELPKIYQHQWRQWDDTRMVVGSKRTVSAHLKHGFELNGPDDGDADSSKTMTRKIDQIQKALHTLRTNPDSRRNIVSAWNVAEIDEMALPPCHTLFQFYTEVMTLDERRAWAVSNGLSDTVSRYDILAARYDKSDTTPKRRDTQVSKLHQILDNDGVPRRSLTTQLYQR